MCAILKASKPEGSCFTLGKLHNWNTDNPKNPTAGDSKTLDLTRSICLWRQEWRREVAEVLQELSYEIHKVSIVFVKVLHLSCLDSATDCYLYLFCGIIGERLKRIRKKGERKGWKRRRTLADVGPSLLSQSLYIIPTRHLHSVHVRLTWTLIA